MSPNNNLFNGEVTQPIPIFNPEKTQPILTMENLNGSTPEGNSFGEWTDQTDERFKAGIKAGKIGRLSATPPKDFTLPVNNNRTPTAQVVTEKLPSQASGTVRNTLEEGGGKGENLSAALPEDIVVHTNGKYGPTTKVALKVPPAIDHQPSNQTTPEIPTITPKSPKRVSGGVLYATKNRLLRVIKGVVDFTFPGLESKGELQLSLSRAQEKGVTELKYRDLLSTLATIKSKNSEEEYDGFLKTIESLHKKAKDNTETVLTQSSSPSPLLQPNNIIPTLVKEAGKKLYLTYSGKKDSPLSKTQLDALLGINSTGLTRKQIDDLVDAAIKKDLEKLRDNKVSILTIDKKPLEQPLSENSQEQLITWKERLGKVTATTKNKLETTLEKLGPAGKKLVSLLTQGSEYLNTQTNSKAVKLFAAVGLVSAGALAAYATPVVLASMAGVGFGLRIVSAAGVYTFARKQLDKKYEQWGREGKNKSALSKAGYEAGAIGFALCGGEILGRVFEGIASMPITQEVGTSIKNVANVASITEYWTNFWNGEVSSSNTASTQPEVPTPVEAATITTTESAAALTTPLNPELQHVVKKGDNLWSLLRKDIANMQLEGFSDLSSGKQERIMRAMLDELNAHGNIPSGQIDKIYPGEVIDYNKIDFKNYLDKYLKN